MWPWEYKYTSHWKWKEEDKYGNGRVIVKESHQTHFSLLPIRLDPPPIRVQTVDQSEVVINLWLLFQISKDTPLKFIVEADSSGNSMGLFYDQFVNTVIKAIKGYELRVLSNYSNIKIDFSDLEKTFGVTILRVEFEDIRPSSLLSEENKKIEVERRRMAAKYEQEQQSNANELERLKYENQRQIETEKNKTVIAEMQAKRAVIEQQSAYAHLEVLRTQGFSNPEIIDIVRTQSQVQISQHMGHNTHYVPATYSPFAAFGIEAPRQTSRDAH